MSNEIKIYVANLGKYNEGHLVGEWFTLPHDLDEIRVAIGVAHYDEEGEFVPYVESPDGFTMYEEWAIHDYEAPFEIKEYTSIEKLNELAEEFDKLSDTQIDIVIALVDNNVVSDYSDAIEALEDNVRIYDDCEDMGDVARVFYEDIDLETIPENIRHAIDWNDVGENLETSGSFYKVSDTVYIEYYG